MKALSDEAKQALFMDLHREIDEQSQKTVARMRPRTSRKSQTSGWERPTTEFELELQRLQLSDSAASAISQALVTTCQNVLFRLFCVMDGVGAPENWDQGPWFGTRLAEPINEHYEMLHDYFFETYEDYRRRAQK